MASKEFIAKLKKATDREIKDNLAGSKYKPEHIPYAELELQRRRTKRADMRSWIAIGISIVSLIVSVAVVLGIVGAIRAALNGLDSWWTKLVSLWS